MRHRRIEHGRRFEALRQMGDIDAPHGRLTLRILIFQDLCVVPMILMVPLLAGTAPPGALVMAALKSAAVLVAVLIAARFLAPRLSIFASVFYAADIERMMRAGATEVVAAELEATVEVTHRILVRCKVQRSEIEAQMKGTRSIESEEDS